MTTFTPALDRDELAAVAAARATGDRRAHLADPVLYRAFYDWATLQSGLSEMPDDEPRLRWVLEHLRPTDDVVDIGAHKLDMTAHLARRTRGRVVAVDLSPEALRWGKTRPGTERVETWAGDACRTPFPDGSFDVAVLCEIVEHVPDEWALLAEAERIVRPGGLVVLTVPSNAAAWDWAGDRAEKARGGFHLDTHVREFIPARALRGKPDLRTRYQRLVTIPSDQGGIELGCRMASYRVTKEQRS